MSKIKIITTEDGSHSLYHEELKETYHSFHGALQESLHVFIDKGLRFWRNKSGLPKSVQIFEVGFGTGLNALLAAQFAIENQVSVDYTTIEPYPVAIDTIKQLNYLTQMERSDLNTLFLNMHEAEWDREIELDSYFKLHKHKTKLEALETNRQFDVMFFDAFAPNKQEELWTKDILAKCAGLLKEGGVFTTYSAKGQLKRDLKAVGFDLETLAGPPGKKEMVRAVLNKN